MANRFVSSEIWVSFEDQSFTRNERMLFVYFITCPTSKASGLFRCPMSRIKCDTLLTDEEIPVAIRGLASRGCAIYDAPLVFIPNYEKWQKSGRMKGWEGHLENTRRELCKNGNEASAAFIACYWPSDTQTIP